jgi:hypothetical protein
MKNTSPRAVRTNSSTCSLVNTFDFLALYPTFFFLINLIKVPYLSNSILSFNCRQPRNIEYFGHKDEGAYSFSQNTPAEQLLQLLERVPSFSSRRIKNILSRIRSWTSQEANLNVHYLPLLIYDRSGISKSSMIFFRNTRFLSDDSNNCLSVLQWFYNRNP